MTIPLLTTPTAVTTVELQMGDKDDVGDGMFMNLFFHPLYITSGIFSRLLFSMERARVIWQATEHRYQIGE